jgi:putative ABC transport system permease protein
MLKLTLRNVIAHKRRLVGTFLAVVIGVGFFSGVTVLTSTVNQTFDDLFSNGNRGTDAYVRSNSKIEVDAGPGSFTQRGRIDESLVTTISAIDGVKAAKPFIQGQGRIVTASGEALGNPDQGPPVFAEAWIDDPALNGWSIVDGRAPERDGEVVIDRKSSKDGKVKVGDTVTVQMVKPVKATVVGIATYAGEDSSGGTTLAAFTVEQAERDLVGEAGKVDGIKVVGDGISQDELVARIQKDMPAGTETLTGAALIKELQDDIQKQFLGFFNILLQSFGAIAVIVAVFSIYNTFSIIVAQRTREMALLRAVGAARSQVLRSVLIEALVVGVVASTVGVFAGLGLALLLKAFLSAAGFGLPASGLVFGVDTLVGGILTGTLVAVFAGLTPAIKATRIPPLAALRDVAVEKTKPSKVRIGIGAVILALAVYNVLSAAIGDGDNALASAGIGALLLLIALVVLGPAVARPVSGLLGLPLPRIRGVTGSLARENAMRNPRRTAGSAMALMIGVGIVAFFTIFASSIKATINGQIDKSFAGDLVVGAGNFGGGGITPQLSKDLAAQPDVQAVSGMRFGVMNVDGKPKQITAADPKNLGQVLDVGVTAGSLDDLGPSSFAVADDVAKDRGWTVGTTLPVRFVDGTQDTFRVAALYDNSDVVGNYVLGITAWQPHAPDSTDFLVAIKLKDGVSLEDGKVAIKPLVDAQAAGSKLQTRAEFRDDQAGQINQFVYFVYAMLGVAIIISLMGIANTLSLSINERTREIGLLRAVGMAREQLKSTIRWEGALISLFGTMGGLALGLVVSWSIAQAAAENGLKYQLPFVALIVLVVLGALAGIVSALLPARRAAKLDVLAAIAHE